MEPGRHAEIVGRPAQGLACRRLKRGGGDAFDLLARTVGGGFVTPATAQVDPGNMEAIKALRGGGHVIVFRHGATHADQADTDPLNLANVAKQRQLNDQGRALAREIGEAMRKLQIPVGQVQTSMFYRAIETGSCSASVR